MQLNQDTQAELLLCPYMVWQAQFEAPCLLLKVPVEFGLWGPETLYHLKKDLYFDLNKYGDRIVYTIWLIIYTGSSAQAVLFKENKSYPPEKPCNNM